MAGFFILVAIIFVAALVVLGPIAFMKLRKAGYNTKNYERGMQMVPLLIHLPPAGDDTDGGGRDVRDVVDENISKAQIIYNIIASTAQKGFKHRWYGQRHFSFEIVGVKGFVYLYAGVPVDMIDVVKQAIVSAYPSARLEEASEHNIFNEVGKLSGTVGGELNLKESFAYPIATYQDLKRDALQALLNALSTLEREDGAAIQILFRPADSSWRKHATGLASKKRKGEDKGISASLLAKEMVTALVKPPEKKEDGNKKELSSLEQSVLDAIDDKTRHAGFEVAIRIIASSNISQRAQTVLNNIIASFSLFDAPGRNGFAYTPAKDMTAFVSEYILRFFPHHKKRNVLNAVEMATLFHFPDQNNIPTSQLERQESKQVDGPRNVPDEGLLLGYNVFRGVKKPIRLSLKDRQRHLYVVGQTGTGKSVFLENLALQDMMKGGGFAFVDPHGDTVETLLSMVPKERTEDVIYFSPADMDYPMGLNLFEFDKPDQKDFLIQEALNMLYKLYDPQHQGIMGPRYEHIFRNAALAIMADPNGGTFVDLPKLFVDPQFLKQKLQHVTDVNVLDFWQKEFPASQRSNESGEVTSWFVSKFGAFRSNEMMRNIIGQTKSSLNLREIMDNKKILLVNLSKGRTGDLNSKLLGMIFVMKFQAAAMSRSDVPEDQRVDFGLYVDEFQNFSTDSFATIMSEARKFHLNLIVANQFTTQLTDEIRDAVFGNIGTIIGFRIGQNDVEALGRYFQPVFSGDDLLRVPNHNTIVRTLIGGVPTQPFSMATLPPLGSPNPQLAGALKQLSAAKYGRPKASVEKDIFARLTIEEPPKPSFANPFTTATAPAPTPARYTTTTPAAPAHAINNPPHNTSGTLRPPNQGSFLDEWLAKQRAGQPTPPIGTLHPATTSPSPVPAVQSQVPSSQALPSPAPAPTPLVAPTALTPAPLPAMGHSGSSTDEIMGNVSSAQLDKQEINDIAKELKRSLKPSKDSVSTRGGAKAAKPLNAEEPAEKPVPQPESPVVSAEEGIIHLKAKMPAQQPVEDEDDTISIDQDGKLRLKGLDSDDT